MANRGKRQSPPGSATLAATPSNLWMQASAEFLRRHTVLGCGALVLLASARIVATYPVFNHTIDEPAHIACGTEWLQKHVYQMEPQHPPLARVLSALGPYLDGMRLPGSIVSMYHAGAVELYADGRYWRRLTLARLGILPLFWIACTFVFLWARRHYGPNAAILAVLLFSILPPVLAHAGLATTDMALTAFTIGAFYWALVFAEHPNWRTGLLLGVTAALAVLSKFSALAFLPVTVGAVAIIYIWLERPSVRAVTLSVRSWIPPLAAAAAAAVLIVWAAYRFSYGPSGFGGLSLPAPELFRGLGSAGSHFEKGHPAYLFGEHSQLGWWYYYFVILAVKTPLAFLALLGVGALVSLRRVRRAWIPLVFSASILVFTMFNRINIGTRHILPVYAGFRDRRRARGA